jgi:hypothetical protein
MKFDMALYRKLSIAVQLINNDVQQNNTTGHTAAQKYLFSKIRTWDLTQSAASEHPELSNAAPSALKSR